MVFRRAYDVVKTYFQVVSRPNIEELKEQLDAAANEDNPRQKRRMYAATGWGRSPGPWLPEPRGAWKRRTL